MPARPAFEGDEVRCSRCHRWHRLVKLNPPDKFIVGKWLHYYCGPALLYGGLEGHPIDFLETRPPTLLSAIAPIANPVDSF